MSLECLGEPALSHVYRLSVTDKQPLWYPVRAPHGRHGCLQSEKQKRQKLQQQRSELATTVQQLRQFYQGSSPDRNNQVLRARHCPMHASVQQLETCSNYLKVPAAVLAVLDEHISSLLQIPALATSHGHTYCLACEAKLREQKGAVTQRGPPPDSPQQTPRRRRNSYSLQPTPRELWMP